MMLNAMAEAAITTPALVAESVATNKAPQATPNIPPKVPLKPYRKAFVSVTRPPGRGSVRWRWPLEKQRIQLHAETGTESDESVRL